MHFPRTTLLALLATASAPFAGLAVEPVDHCATMLGSLAVELRHARGLPPGQQTRFACPRRFHPLIGASRARILRALGPPDASDADRGWTYYFAGKQEQRPPGTARLLFSFDGSQQVNSVDCRRLRDLPAAPSAEAPEAAAL